MTKKIKIEYIECDCKQGRLEELTKTNESPGYVEVSSNDYGGGYYDIEQTIFYNCDRCDKIYQADKTLPPTGNSSPWTMEMINSDGTKERIDSYNENIKHYNGKLNKNKLKKYVPGTTGHWNEYHEGCALACEQGKLEEFIRGKWKP